MLKFLSKWKSQIMFAVAMVLTFKLFADAVAPSGVTLTADAAQLAIETYKNGGWLAVLRLLAVLAIGVGSGVGGQNIAEHTVMLWITNPTYNWLKAATPMLLGLVLTTLATKFGATGTEAGLIGSLTAWVMWHWNGTSMAATATKTAS